MNQFTELFLHFASEDVDKIVDVPNYLKNALDSFWKVEQVYPKVEAVIDVIVETT